MQTSQKPVEELSKEELYKKELEDFLYLVSHDLHAPLRHVREFSRLLLRRLENHIGQEEQQYVEFIERSLSRSEQMIGALQEYSRLSTRAKPWQAFDLNAVVHEALLKHAEQIERYNVRVETDGLPENYVADRDQTRLLFEILIDNSIKFRLKDVIPRIVISCKQEGGAYHFRFEDDGPGVEQDYAENVFEMFKRGSTRESVPGVGAGLAIAQKIVRRHGGRITIDHANHNGLVLQWSHPVLQAGQADLSDSRIKSFC